MPSISSANLRVRRMRIASRVSTADFGAVEAKQSRCPFYYQELLKTYGCAARRRRQLGRKIIQHPPFLHATNTRTDDQQQFRDDELRACRLLSRRWCDKQRCPLACCWR